jgi:hypothetical protein
VANLQDEKLFSEIIRFKAEVLYRFRRIKNLIEENYHETTDPHTIYDAVLKLVQQAWLHEQFDELERRRRRALASSREEERTRRRLAQTIGDRSTGE